MDKKSANWKSLADFQKVMEDSKNPIVVAFEKQTTNPSKVTMYWTESSTCSLFEEDATYKVSITITLAEKLLEAGVVTKENKSADTESDLLKLLAEKIAEKIAAAEEQE